MALYTGQKITILRISEVMACTSKYLATIRGKNPVTVNDNDVYHIQLKGKRNLACLALDEKTIVLDGWHEQLVDTDTNRFCGNACYNLLGSPDEVRALVDKQLNPNFAEKDRVVAVKDGHEIVVYPELVQRGHHAVIDRLIQDGTVQIVN